MQDGGAFVSGFAFQIPGWVVLIAVVAVVFGVWKVARLIWAALSN